MSSVHNISRRNWKPELAAALRAAAAGDELVLPGADLLLIAKHAAKVLCPAEQLIFTVAEKKKREVHHARS